MTSVVPAGSGRIEVVPSPGKDGKYLQGSNLLVTAVSSPGYQFVGWAGSAGGPANPLGITAISNLSIVAVFGATTAAAPAPSPTAATQAAPSPTPESGLAGVFGKALAPTPTPVPAQATTASLLGTWQCQVQTGQQQASAVLVFQSGSSLLVNGQPISYALVPEGIRFGTDTLTLSVAGDSLVMTYKDGSRFQCQRAQPATAGATPTSASGQAAGTQQSLLGTWQCQATLGGQTGSMVFVFESASSMRVNGQP
ncbi:MAG: hypothetical protein Q7K03_08170, partial [Dehalococcoidia bacterium]|nr:hypothetical protein [Dehalococcoidia bacterium]